MITIVTLLLIAFKKISVDGLFAILIADLGMTFLVCSTLVKIFGEN